MRSAAVVLAGVAIVIAAGCEGDGGESVAETAAVAETGSGSGAGIGTGAGAETGSGTGTGTGEDEVVVAVAGGGDVSLSSGPLTPSRGTHAFDVALECPLARVELDYEIEGRPAGTITLRAPGGLEAREGMRVLTTPHFVRTLDWMRLSDLHPARGTSIRGRWTTTYALQEVPRHGDRYDPRAPQLVHDVRLRLFCEPATQPAVEPEIHGHVELEARAPRPGANLRALLAVTRACTVDSLAIELQAEREFRFGDAWLLVAPDGSRHRVGTFFPARDGAEQKLVANVDGAEGLASAGIWELVAPRAGRDLVLRRFGLAIRCSV